MIADQPMPRQKIRRCENGVSGLEDGAGVDKSGGTEALSAERTGRHS